MFRRYIKPISYKKEGITIRRASLGEEYDIGGWATSYDWIKMGYEYEKYQSRYSDISYVITNKFGIFGYFLANQEINVGNNPNIPLYCKELIICDFVVDIKSYAKHSKILLDFMIKYAKHYGYSVISFYNSDQYSVFNKFISKYYGVKLIDDKYYLFINNPNVRSYQRHLTVYDNDNISIENIYFLYDLGFDVLKTKCKFKLNDNEEISIDRKTGIISFPSNVNTTSEVVLNDVTKSLVYTVKFMYHANDIKNVDITYDVNNPNYYEAIINKELYISKDLNEIRDDIDYMNSLINRGYDKVISNQLRYNMNESSFSDSPVIYKLVK